jgi:hypothetical protein
MVSVSFNNRISNLLVLRLRTPLGRKLKTARETSSCLDFLATALQPVDLPSTVSLRVYPLYEKAAILTQVMWLNRVPE